MQRMNGLDTNSASLTILALMMFWNLNMICCRVSGEVLDQLLYADFADSTAASISAFVVFGTRVTTCTLSHSNTTSLPKLTP